MTTYDERACPAPFKAGGCAAEDVYFPPGGGILTGPPAALKADLAACPAWQSWAGTDYLNHIHVIGARRKNPCAFTVPFAVIEMTQDSSRLRIDTGPFVNGSMLLWFQDATPQTYYDDPESAYNYFCTPLEQVLVQLFPWANGSLVKRTMEPVDPPWQNKSDDDQLFYIASYMVAYGVE